MRRAAVVVALGLAPLVLTGTLRAQGEPPAWAYAITPPPPAGAPAPKPAPPDTSPKQLPGSSRTFTLAEVRNMFGPADWFPEEHPAMPAIVANGRQPEARACAMCHYPNGKGRPENAPVSGLPVSYFVQTMNDFRNDLRKTGEPRKPQTNVMIQIAKAMTPEEIQASAEYYGSMKWTPWIRVVETAMVPKTRAVGGIWMPLAGNEQEPIGMRIIETPEDVGRADLRDPRSGFVAYAPVGSIRRGEALVTTGGNGRTVQCGVCHGADLNGLGPVPGIAGRSPSYLVRQMYDMKAGARQGEWAAMMKPVVDRLTDEDFVAIAAYVASRMP